jgi:5-methylcytosine-specific restriction endonuclease McrA
MRIEIILFLVTAFVVTHIYSDGKYTKMLFKWKKYYKMAAVVVGAFFFYWMVKHNPLNASQMIMASNDYIKYLPIDKGTSNIISPILDFTSKQNFGTDGNNTQYPILPLNTLTTPVSPYEKRMMKSGMKSTKRSVSETKKKFVASRQNWHCGNCQKQLTAWFEVDHKIRLEYGGSNHIDNLVALCRECHGEKTTMENL